jgi:hypothetical protein
MKQLCLWGPGAALAIATISLIVALDGRSDETAAADCDCQESPTATPQSHNGQVSLFDRLTWGSGHEPVIYG